VARHIFQACPVWMYTQSDITNIIFTWVHYTNTEKNHIHFLHCISLFGTVFRKNCTALKADFQSSWALSSNHNAKQLILIRCKQSQRAARSFVRGLENRLKSIRIEKFYHVYYYRWFSY
jgi:predicted Fe-S protein YdhL (DUF1289 family)